MEELLEIFNSDSLDSFIESNPPPRTPTRARGEDMSVEEILKATTQELPRPVSPLSTTPKQTGRRLKSVVVRPHKVHASPIRVRRRPFEAQTSDSAKRFRPASTSGGRFNFKAKPVVYAPGYRIPTRPRSLASIIKPRTHPTTKKAMVTKSNSAHRSMSTPLQLTSSDAINNLLWNASFKAAALPSMPELSDNPWAVSSKPMPTTTPSVKQMTTKPALTSMSLSSAMSNLTKSSSTSKVPPMTQGASIKPTTTKSADRSEGLPPATNMALHQGPATAMQMMSKNTPSTSKATPSLPKQSTKQMIVKPNLSSVQAHQSVSFPSTSSAAKEQLLAPVIMTQGIPKDLEPLIETTPIIRLFLQTSNVPWDEMRRARKFFRWTVAGGVVMKMVRYKGKMKIVHQKTVSLFPDYNLLVPSLKTTCIV